MGNNFIHKSAGIIIRDRKLLVEKSEGKDFFSSPGGQIEDGEDLKKTLKRELKEELNIDTKEESFEYFGTYNTKTTRTFKDLVVGVFMVKEWEGEPTPNMEVKEIKWIDSSNSKKLKLGSILEEEILPKLKKMKLID